MTGLARERGVVAAVDLGTSRIKAARVRVADGLVEATATREVRNQGLPVGHVDAVTLESAARTALESVWSPDVGALGVSAAMHSLVVVNEDEVPVGPATTWECRLADAVWRRATDDTWDRTGTPWHPMSPAVRWEALRRQGLVAAGHRPRALKDWILWRWTGRLATDYATAAAAGLINRETRTWDAALLDRLHLSPRLLPPLANGRSELGLLHAVPVVLGLSDGAIAHVGWPPEPQEASLTLGTSGAIRRLVPDHGQAVSPYGLFAYAVDERFSLIGGAVSDGGNLLDWWAGITGSALDEIVGEALESGAHGVMADPFWHGARAPFWDRRQGALHGLTGTTDRGQVAAALLDGVLGSLAAVARRLEAFSGPVEQYRATGGLLRDPRVAERLAGILERPLLVAEDWDASLMGAARLAAEAVAVPGRWTVPHRVVRPPAGSHDVWDAVRRRWMGRDRER